MPIAAHTVSLGCMRSIDGNNKPTAPRNSLMPMNLTKATGTCVTQGREVASCSTGWVDFIAPAIRNIAANIPCATHKEMFNAFEDEF